MPAARRATYAELATGVDDGQWVEVEGIVRSFLVQAEDNVLVIDVAAATGTFKVRIPEFHDGLPKHLVDAEVRFHGVCGTAFNVRGQLVAVHLFVPRIADLTVIDPAPADPFSIPPRPIASLERFSIAVPELHRALSRT
jgi:hypothetical protein